MRCRQAWGSPSRCPGASMLRRSMRSVLIVSVLMMCVLTRCSRIVSSRIVSVLIISQLIVRAGMVSMLTIGGGRSRDRA